VTLAEVVVVDGALCACAEPDEHAVATTHATSPMKIRNDIGRTGAFGINMNGREVSVSRRSRHLVIGFRIRAGESITGELSAIGFDAHAPEHGAFGDAVVLGDAFDEKVDDRK
jgi:hypothetical protein